MIDPQTIKIRQLVSTVTEEELRDLLAKHGQVQRVRIPRDEATKQSKGIGFVTFHSEAVCAALVKEGFIKYDFYELPVEAAYFSAQLLQKREEQRQREERRQEREKRGEGGEGRGSGQPRGRGGRRDGPPREEFIIKRRAE